MSQLFVTTGPESSGKTTLAAQLAAALPAPLVEEAARAYLTDFYRLQPKAHYSQQDLLAIAKLQLAAEQQALASASPLLVCDTDLLVILIWSEVRYGCAAAELLQMFERSLTVRPRRYLLCDHHIAWEADPLREHPLARDSLALRYRQRLDQLALPYLVVNGAPAQRLQQVLSWAPVAGVQSP